MRRWPKAYMEGEPYRPPRGRTGPRCRPATCALPIPGLLNPAADWPAVWDVIQTPLRQCGFQTGTLRVYRQILRTFRAHLSGTTSQKSAATSPTSDARRQPSGNNRQPTTNNQQQNGRNALPHALCAMPSAGPRPASITTTHIDSFISRLVAAEVSASWLTLNIAVLRTVFDKLGGRSLTRHLSTPKKPQRLPDILAESEMRQLLAELPRPRDRLIVGLLYGCGLKVGELCRLTWADMDPEAGQVHVQHGRERTAVVLPPTVLPVLLKGKQVCAPETHVFPGERGNPHLAERQVERIIASAARRAGVLKPVCCMTLRHSYAVSRLKAGDNIRDVQICLGHQSVKTTLQYMRLIIPESARAAVNRLVAQVFPAQECNGLRAPTAETTDDRLRGAVSPGGRQSLGATAAEGCHPAGPSHANPTVSQASGETPEVSNRQSESGTPAPSVPGAAGDGSASATRPRCGLADRCGETPVTSAPPPLCHPVSTDDQMRHAPCPMRHAPADLDFQLDAAATPVPFEELGNPLDLFLQSLKTVFKGSFLAVRRVARGTG